jgi:nicotinamide mononucleotide adenylyltransferase
LGSHYNKTASAAGESGIMNKLTSDLLRVIFLQVPNHEFNDLSVAWVSRPWHVAMKDMSTEVWSRLLYSNAGTGLLVKAVVWNKVGSGMRTEFGRHWEKDGAR